MLIAWLLCCCRAADAAAAQCCASSQAFITAQVLAQCAAPQLCYHSLLLVVQETTSLLTSLTVNFCNLNLITKTQFVVVLLVASIPIAMEVVVTTTMALGSRQLSRMNAIVARLSAIEELAGMNMLCSDKTGTLALNKMVILQKGKNSTIAL